jgi:penicillin-binding protein 1A
MRLITILITLFICFCSLLGGSFLYFAHHFSFNVFALQPKFYNNPTILLDDQGKEWGRFELYHCHPTVLSSIPPSVINAFVAAEDHNFFRHPGISLKGIIRSLLINFYHQRKIQGASTITQQLTRLLFLDNQKTFIRKIKEQVYAIFIELSYTKEQILEAYLNNIYLGCGIYGIQAACHTFWKKPVEHLQLHEAATLAAIIKSPAHFCPLINPEKTRKRRNIVLHSMLHLKLITSDEYKEACNQPLITLTHNDANCAPHFKEFLRGKLEKLVGKQDLYNKGFVVQTTLNHSMQENASATFIHHLRNLRKTLKIPLDGAVVTLESSSGAVKTWVGGYDFVTSKLNRVVHIKRQIGSLIKPLIYAQALGKGLKLTDVWIDEPFQLEYDNQTWAPRNVSRTFAGPMTLAHALATSNNIIAIKLLLHLGISPLIDLLKQCKIEENLEPYPSLALGCVETCPLKTAALFNIFANNGIYNEPYYIEWIKDESGKKIYRHILQSHSIISWSIASQINSALSLTSKHLQERLKEALPYQSIAKTGTTNDARTCSFAGSTPDFTTSIYLGCDDNRPLKNVYASTTAFPLWFDIHKNFPCYQVEFNYDPHLKKITVDHFTGEFSTNGIELLAGSS